MRSGYGLVLSKLADAQALVGAGWGDWQAPGPGRSPGRRPSSGRSRSGCCSPGLRCRPARSDTPGVFYAGLRVVTVDGFTLDLQDTAENAEFFGRGGNGCESANPYPQLRALVLAESGTRSLLAAAHGPSGVGEQTLAAGPAAGAGAGDAGAGRPELRLLQAVAGRGRGPGRTCAGGSRPRSTCPCAGLIDGTYLSQLRPPRKKDGPPIRSGWWSTA